MKQENLIRALPVLEKEKKSGTLRLAHEEKNVYFDLSEGLVQRVSSNLSGRQLWDYLKETRSVSSSKLNKLRSKAEKRKEDPALLLVNSGLLSLAQVSSLLRRQALELGEACLSNGFRIEGFTTQTAKQASPGPGFGANIAATDLLIHLARRYSEPIALDAATLVSFDRPGEDISRSSEVVPSAAVRRTSRAIRSILEQIEELRQGDWSSFPWEPEELAVLVELSRSSTVLELAEKTGLKMEDLRAVLGRLDWLGLIVFSEDRSGVARKEQKAVSLEHLVPRIRRPPYAEKVEVHHQNESFVSEQFKSLKVRIRGMRATREMRAITITSSHMGDGKSLVSANLAVSLAEDRGQRVVAIDCDLRKPNLHNYFGISEGPGLRDYLDFEERLPPHAFLRRVDDLFLMTSGGTAENPVELLSHPRMKELLDYLKEHFDMVLLDAPPLQPISDTRILDRLGDGTILVIRRGKTPYGSVERAAKFLDREKVLGVVFNEVRPQLFNTYYYYQYYDYGSESGYPYQTAAKGESGTKRHHRRKDRTKRPPRSPNTILNLD